MSDKMKERIDALIKVRRERPELHYVWATYYNRLNDVLQGELKEFLATEWVQIEIDEKMNDWDEHFCESIITGQPYGWQEPADTTIVYPQQAQRLVRGGVGISAYESDYSTQTTMQMAEHIRLQQEKQRLDLKNQLEKQRLDLKNQFRSYSGPDFWNTI